MDMNESRKNGDKIGECRAFRNLGDAFKAQGMIERASDSSMPHPLRFFLSTRER